MANYELGQAGLNPRGVYNSTTAYKKLDCVSYEGSSHIALMDNTGVPVTNDRAYMYLAVGAEYDVVWKYLNLVLVLPRVAAARIVCATRRWTTMYSLPAA